MRFEAPTYATPEEAARAGVAAHHQQLVGVAVCGGTAVVLLGAPTARGLYPDLTICYRTEDGRWETGGSSNAHSTGCPTRASTTTPTLAACWPSPATSTRVLMQSWSPAAEGNTRSPVVGDLFLFVACDEPSPFDSPDGEWPEIVRIL